MAYVIGAACIDVKDKSCMDECPVDCIYEGERMLYIHPDECIDCGACEPVCPTEAIVSVQNAGDEWAPFVKAAEEVCGELGFPGGASNISAPVPDTEFVRTFVVED